MVGTKINCAQPLSSRSVPGSCHHTVLVQDGIVLILGEHCEPIDLVIVKQIVPSEVIVLGKQNCLLDLVLGDIVDLGPVVEQGNCTA